MQQRPNRRALVRVASVAMSAALVVLCLGSSSVLARSGGQAALAATRAATAAYHDLSTAEAAGYGLFPGCFAHAEGGMGVHYVDFSSVADGKVDPLKPEALVYEPLRGGGMRLVAVEWVVIAASWTGSEPPSVFGQPLEYVDTPNEFGLPPFYELHAWIWQPNPLGMFHEWNPAVTCAYAR
jgi:hypothetical protein